MITLFYIIIGILLCTKSGNACNKSEFQCKDGTCVSLNKFCNRIADCNDGSDEYSNCTPCNKTYFGIVGQTYELELKHPKNSKELQLPFVCYLNFTAGGESIYGELIQISFESFSVGTFEPFANIGCSDGHISIRETNRPDTGGKWCGSAWGYTVYYSETSSINLTLALNKFASKHSNLHLELKVSYKFLKVSDARLRYGNSTLRSYRGKLNPETYCDQLLEGCSRRPCRIQSPNYPGIYPRNVTCHYRVRERNVPQGMHALITLRQANFHYKEHSLGKFDVEEHNFRIWDECNALHQDYLEVVDGWGVKATRLAHLCSGETIPSIISSGPELLVKFHTSTYGNPFHPLPLSYLPGFELEIHVSFVKKESPTYIEPGKKCEFLVTTYDKTSGFLQSPLHSLPPNTTCHYLFHGQVKEVIWISFFKYHVTNERLMEFNAGDECDVELQVWDGDVVEKEGDVEMLGRFCKDDKPKLCAHTMLSNSSRFTRPCGLTESYTSSGPDLTITHNIRFGSVLNPVNFALRYEFIDLSQDGTANPKSNNPCDRLFRQKNGKFASPKITFLFGRGGQKDLLCTYQFESVVDQSWRFTFNRANFGKRASNCYSEFDLQTNRWICNGEFHNGIKIAEFPWAADIQVQRGCFCTNITKPISVRTRTARLVIVTFVIEDMQIDEDQNDYYFEGSFEFVAREGNCLNPWQNRTLRGPSGEIIIHSPASVNHTNIVYCLEQPWLIEPEQDGNFIYLKIKGSRKDSRLCPSRNRILVYPVGTNELVYVICPDDFQVVELFSEGWTHAVNNFQRGFIVEFLQRENGNFGVTWMEISKNPAMLSSIVLPDCPHNCPELGACISAELWCDGFRHCPSGNDEQEANCSFQEDFTLIAHLNYFALSAIVVVSLVIGLVAFVYIFKHWKHQQMNVMVTVTEHTFLEFKSGLC